ncbi:MAG: competence/damage-inducible protein A [Gemmatimonadales bacterium]|nr:competence/damage-inducible protein A [Gemmatimonadales bacterium]
MRLELVTIGSELLLGHTIDTNGAELGVALAAAGVTVTRRTTVADTPEAIREAVAEALARTGAVLTTGGLGPTRDDMTKAVVAALFEAPLAFDPALWDDLVARFARVGRVPSERNRSQAEVPAGATVLPNRWGTAPGLWLEGAPGLAILLPGVPSELRGLLRHEVAPRLAARAGAGRVTRSVVLRTTGIPESTLAERVGEVEEGLAPLSLAYLPGVTGVDLRLTAWSLPPGEAEARLAAGLALLRERAEAFAYAEGEGDLADVVLARCRASGRTLAVAESCTGGLLGARLTAIPGSSDVVLGGVIAYANALKTGVLNVPASLLAAHGAVSEPVALAMAQGARARTGAALGVAITGVAGPGGGSAEKPVGTVWIALAYAAGVEARRFVFHGDRGEVRARAAQSALDLVRRHLLAAVPRAGASED